MRKRKIRITIDLPAYRREVFRKAAKLSGKSISSHVIDLILKKEDKETL